MSNPNLDVITVIQPNSSPWPLTPKEFWKWREAFYRLIIKEFQVRFRDTQLGFIWIVLQPLIALGIFSIVLTHKNDLAPTEMPYSVYILSGLIFWTFISNGFIQGSQCLYESRTLIVQTNLKRSLIPLSILSSKLIDLLFGLVFLLAWIFFDSRVKISPQAILLPLDILGMLIVLIGVTFSFSSLCIQYKDIRYIVPFLAQVLFFATPILYVMPNTSKSWILYLNPLTIFVLAVRDHALGTHFITWGQYGLAYAYAAALFMAGSAIFRKFERTFADII